MPQFTDGVYRPGDLSENGWQAVVDDRIEGWKHTGLRIAQLDGSPRVLPAADVERMIVPLAGAFSVSFSSDDETAEQPLTGRASVFEGPTDVLYLGSGTAATIDGRGRVAVAEAPTTARRPATYVPVDEVAVELRGAGRSSRQVHNFGVPGASGAPDAVKLIVCEVITPAENWSSYPPHKHDTWVPGVESELEEIYYFETAVARDAPETVHEAGGGPHAAPFALFSAYASDQRPLKLDARVGTGDIALVPYGYHGPAVAAPGYDLYYLNVMAGPGDERSWLITDDPAQAWVRDLWRGQAPDPRLPYTPRTATKGAAS